MKKPRKAYLNYAMGIRRQRKPSKIPGVSPRRLFGRLRIEFSRHFFCRPQDIKFAQNVTTHVAQIVTRIKKKIPSAQVCVDSHEVAWIPKSLEAGSLVTENITSPNFAGLKQKRFPATQVRIIDPKTLLQNISMISSGDRPVVIVLSHVSRLSGETFPVKEIYRKMKKINPDSVLVVDGAQVAGAMKFDVRDSCDAYIGMTSKFIGGQPNLAVAYLSPEFGSKYLGKYPSIKASEFASEAHSAMKAFSHPVFKRNFSERINRMRSLALSKLKGVKGISVQSPPNQAPQIITIKVGNRQKTLETVEKLKKRGVEIFHNLGYSVVEPARPLLRVSIGAKTSRVEIDKFVEELRSIVS